MALLLNEVRQVVYKKIVQTIFYAPHFLSWVIVSGIFVGILSPSSGIVNVMLGWFGIDPIYFLGEDSYIRTVLVGSGLWRDVGWGPSFIWRRSQALIRTSTKPPKSMEREMAPDAQHYPAGAASRDNDPVPAQNRGLHGLWV